ncbi:MAG: hypothetical protein IT564_06805 [Rhodospirillales bacterium]|nr:hypothetical protein [Rhodospirillales bacterium]
MPLWLVGTLKWGGSAAAVVAVITLVYVRWLLPAAQVTASATRYWILLGFGVVSAIVGFAVDRRKPKSGV